MNQFIKAFAVSGLFLVAGNLYAQDDTEVTEDTGWTGKGEFGYVSTSGNTDTNSLNVALAFERETPLWRFKIGGTALSSSKNGEKDAERYTAAFQVDRKFGEKSYAFAGYRYDADKFGAYDPAQSVTAGYGRQLMNTEKNELNGEIGAGYKKMKATDTGEVTNEFIVRLMLNDVWHLTKTTDWINHLLVEAGSENTFTQFDTGVVVSMNDKFALKFGWEYRHNTTVPPGTADKTDTTTTANLVYNFK